MIAIWATLAIAGFLLTLWANISLPSSVDRAPVPIKTQTFNGPYKFSDSKLWPLRHPMYSGNVAFVTGLAGLGGGFFTAFAAFTLAELLMRDWASREEL